MDGATKAQLRVLRFADYHRGRQMFTAHQDLNKIFGDPEVDLRGLVEEGLMTFRWLTYQKSINMPFLIKTTKKGREYIRQLERLEAL